MMQLLFGDNPSIRLNYIRIVSFTLLPFMVVIISWAFWFMYGCCKQMGAQERNDKSVATISIVLFLFYPTIVTYLAESVNCAPVEGVMRLYSDLEEQCYTGTHTVMIVLVSMPGLLCWAFGIPLFFLRRLRVFR